MTKSLVTRDGSSYRLLEPIRQFAADRLALSADGTAVADRHLMYFVQVAEELGLSHTTSGSAGPLDLLRRNAGNVRAALSHAFDPATVHDSLGVRLVGATSWRWFIDGTLDEGRAWTERAVEAATEINDDHVSQIALYARATISLAQADMDTTMRVGIRMQAPGTRNEPARLAGLRV